MNQAIYDKIRSDKVFLRLVKKRRNFIWSLTLIIFVAYYSFILLVAFNPSFLAQKFEGSLITFGMPFGIGIIFLCFILTGVYTKRANDEFDMLTNEIKQRIEDHQ